MDQITPQDNGYQRLLSELCARLGAHAAELLLGGGTDAPARPIGGYSGPGGVEPASTWLEIPICEGVLEVGRLRLAFAPGARLPELAEHGTARSLLDLAALLAEEHHSQTWAPLREAGRRMLAVTEEELQRIILDIHDGPVQKLFVVSSQLALLQARLGDYDGPAREDLGPMVARMEELVQSALQEIKSALSTFRPAEFQRRTLSSVLQGLAMQHEALTGNQVDLQIEGPIPPVSMPVKIALFRVLQEALSNAYRHAGVDRHQVRLSRRDGWVQLEVADEGRGFTPPPLEGPGATEREEHIGLRGMRERMLLVGGQLRVISQIGQGTRVIVRVPSDE
ncbi:MAG: hypothetical protein OHK0022_57620 [Roseiflexaceae bacterium]